MIDPSLLAHLRCPVSSETLQIAEKSLIDRLNAAILREEVRDPHDQKISAPLDGGLITAGGGRLYPIRGGIPSLIADGAIDLHQLSNSDDTTSGR